MTLELPKQRDRPKQSAIGVDLKRVFKSDNLNEGWVRTPSRFYPLPDARPASEMALADALKGIAPKNTGLADFDPLLGPFTLDASAESSWAQSLDFLRDIQSASIRSAKLSKTWVRQYLSVAESQLQKPNSFFTPSRETSTKTDRLIWRARRILNSCCYILPVLDESDDETLSIFWQVLMTDIAKLASPTETLWASLRDGFDPLSPRAIWLRAIALVGVEAAIPGLLRTDLIQKSIDQIKTSFQNDGMFVGGSIMATLAAGADLCLLTRIHSVEPILARVRTALCTLRAQDGTLVTFGTGAADYAHLVSAIIGSRAVKPTTLLLESGIGRLCTSDTTIWLRVPQSDQNLGAVAQVEVKGGALLTQSSVIFETAVNVSQARCKRRDEQDFLMLEVSATLLVDIGGHASTVNSLRQIRVARNGLLIEGEDMLRLDMAGPARGRPNLGVKEIHFGIPTTCKCLLSHDKSSVLIVTSQQQAWRFRIQGMDMSVELRADRNAQSLGQAAQRIIVCRCLDLQRIGDFRTTWQLVVEEIE